jgi:hypothetical protein
MPPIDFAAEVVELRRRFHERMRRVSAGERSAELRAAIRADADVLAVCIEESDESSGSWSRLYDDMERMVREISH